MSGVSMMIPNPRIALALFVFKLKYVILVLGILKSWLPEVFILTKGGWPQTRTGSSLNHGHHIGLTAELSHGGQGAIHHGHNPSLEAAPASIVWHVSIRRKSSTAMATSWNTTFSTKIWLTIHSDKATIDWILKLCWNWKKNYCKDLQTWTLLGLPWE